MAVVSQLEYRFNFFSDTVLQPVITAGIEMTLWSAIFTTTQIQTLGGFSREMYVIYALWAAFFARIAPNWMYDIRMVDEIDTGTVNSILVRPISFYEYYLSQFIGYKVLTSGFSLLVPFVISFFILGHNFHYERLPLALALELYYLILVHTLSFTVSCFGFFFNRVHSFTVAKNITLWMLSGEIFPLDLVASPFRGWLMLLPFSCGVYRPVGYLTGRISASVLMMGFVSITVALVVLGCAAYALWLAGRRNYSGTGA
jgi:ABC-2 type transport system permease protein